jgi:hypothetical protein
MTSSLGTRVDLIVLHDCERGDEGSIRWFETSRSRVSARYVVRRTATRRRKMVDLPTMPGARARSIDAPLVLRWGVFASRGFEAL